MYGPKAQPRSRQEARARDSTMNPVDAMVEGQGRRREHRRAARRRVLYRTCMNVKLRVCRIYTDRNLYLYHIWRRVTSLPRRTIAHSRYESVCTRVRRGMYPPRPVRSTMTGTEEGSECPSADSGVPSAARKCRGRGFSRMPPEPRVAEVPEGLPYRSIQVHARNPADCAGWPRAMDPVLDGLLRSTTFTSGANDT